MIIMSWNCWGFGNRRAVQVRIDLVRSKGPTVLFLMETKLSIQEMEPIKNEIGFNSMLAVLSIRRSGGIPLLWKNSVTVDPQTFSLNHIDVYISAPLQEQWRLTGVYGHPEDQRKKETWEHTRHLQSWTMKLWVCIRDFNEVLQSNEKRGGLTKPLSVMQEFWSALLHCDLANLGYQGYTYTWWNGHFSDDFVEQRLE